MTGATLVTTMRASKNPASSAVRWSARSGRRLAARQQDRLRSGGVSEP